MCVNLQLLVIVKVQMLEWCTRKSSSCYIIKKQLSLFRIRPINLQHRTAIGFMEPYYGVFINISYKGAWLGNTMSRPIS